MSFLPAVGGSSLPKISSHSSNKRDLTAKCLLQFSGEFLYPQNTVTEWYSGQPHKQFRTVQYRKENAGVRHEFILILLQGQDDDTIVSHCRLERMGDSDRPLQTIYVDGTISRDYIQAVPLHNPESIKLSQNSDLVLEITFPITFDLRDVLAVCYGISRHRKAKRYTLLQYNCYFFSWTVVMVLARACLRWGGGSLQNHIQNTQGVVIRSFIEDEPDRLHTLPYILSNNPSPTRKAGEEHSLDAAIKSKVSGNAFADLIAEAVHRVLWVDTLRSELTPGLVKQLEELAKETFNLLEQHLSEDDEAVMPHVTSQPGLDPEILLTVRKAAEKAVIMGVSGYTKGSMRHWKEAAKDAAVVRQRLGTRAWYRCVRRGMLGSTTPCRNNDRDSPEHPRSHQLTESPIKDQLLILPTSVLSTCFRLGVTGVRSIRTAVLHNNTAYHHTRRLGNESRLYLKARCFGSTILRSVLAIPEFWAMSKQYEYAFAVHYAVEHELRGDFSEFRSPFDEVEPSRFMSEGWVPALKLMNDVLNEIKANDVPHSCVLGRILLTIFQGTPDQILLTDIDDLWDVFILAYLDRMVEVAHSELQLPVGQTSAEAAFLVVGRKAGPEISPETILNTDNRKGMTIGVEGSNAPSLDRSKAPHHATPDSDTWSYDTLQQFIRGRISQLSNRESEFAPALKHIPQSQSPEICQVQIEATIQEIWGSCHSLMVSCDQEMSRLPHPADGLD